MRVLDANFLIDYLSGIQATQEYYATNGGDDETWIIEIRRDNPRL